MPRSLAKPLFAIASVVVAASVVTAIVVLGPPSEQRQQRLDAIRIEHLQRIEQQVQSYAKLHRQLPESLEALGKELGYAVPPSDPESGRPYTYELLSRDRFRICATFATSSYTHQEMDNPFGARIWAHRAGVQCFDRRLEALSERAAHEG